MTSDRHRDSDFLERPAFTLRLAETPAFALDGGQLLAERFEIVRPLGYGGMGEVYEAFDRTLQTRVALKTIRPTVAALPGGLQQFRTEVLRARSVSHPHVCRVHDLFAHHDARGTLQFLTMELLEGETLAARLARDGALDVRTAAKFGQQMAAALDEAHQRGIVHRDFKPGNIMLVGAGAAERVVITDFGLARALDEIPRGASPASAVEQAGTAPYMAPELFDGGPVTPAVDIYSFGVVLHEMVAGGTPSTRTAAAEAGADPGENSGEQIPRTWRKAVAACLAETPGERPASAAAAIMMATGERGRVRQRAIATLATAFLLLSVALYTPLTRYLRLTPEFDANPSILVSTFENATGEVELDGIAELLRRQLEQSPNLTVLESAQVSEVLRTMAQPPDSALTIARSREVVWRAGASGFVSGRTWRAGQGYGLAVRLERRSEQPDTTGTNWSRAFEARDQQELLRRIQEAANWIRAAAGEAASDIPRHDRSVADVTTSSWRALHLYSRAEALFRESRRNDGLALLAEAVRLDPDFALASMRMGDVLMSERRFEEAYRHWERANEILRQRNLGSREEYRVRGMLASDTEDFVEAERVYRLYLVNYPHDFRPYFYIARALLMLGRTDQAIAMLEEAKQRSPNELSVHAQLAMYRIRAGRLDEVGRDLARLRELGHDAWAQCYEAQLAFVRGDYNRALAGFRALESSTVASLRTRAPALQGAVYADLGLLNEAVAQFTRGAGEDARRGEHEARADKLLARAGLELRRGRKRDARDLAVQVEQIDHSTLRLGRVGAIYAQAGSIVDARRVLERLPQQTASRRMRIDRIRLDAEIRLAAGDARAAWVEFQRAAALEAPGVLAEYLARGAAAAGETGTARALFERMARDTGYYWRYPGDDPGRWFHALRQYISLTPTSAESNDALRRGYDALQAYILSPPIQ